MKEPATTSKPRRGDIFTVFVAIVGLLIAFANVYEFAQKAQPGNAVVAGVVVFALTFVLSVQLAKMRGRKG